MTRETDLQAALREALEQLDGIHPDNDDALRIVLELVFDRGGESYSRHIDEQLEAYRTRSDIRYTPSPGMVQALNDIFQFTSQREQRRYWESMLNVAYEQGREEEASE